MKEVAVVAALIWKGDRFLICQRPANKTRGLLWEFVGGKTESGETLRQALARECREELDIELFAGSTFMEVLHSYPDITVRLTVFECFIAKGEPKMLEHNDIKWIKPEEIENFDFCPADEEILKKIKESTDSHSPTDILTGRLMEAADSKYKAFHCRLMPTVPSDRVIGVRTPELRKISKEFAVTEAAKNFLKQLPHDYYELNNIHADLLSKEKDYGKLISGINDFLPFVDNWATCDMFRPNIFKKHLDKLMAEIKSWIASEQTYTVRFGLEMIMNFYLDEAFKTEYLELAAEVRSNEYYVNMMLAWLFATALAKQYSATVPFIENRRLDKWTHNKAIQKAVESYRITESQKDYLKSLKIR